MREQVKKQTQQIEQFIVEGVDALVVAPVASAALGAEILRANRAGIPVFTVDVQIEAKGAAIARHVASDNYQGGKLAGLALVEAMNGKGDAVILTMSGLSSIHDRVRGFRDVVSHVPAIRLLDDQVTDGGRGVSYEATEKLLKVHPGLAGIFAVNDQIALGAFDAILMEVRKTPVLVGYDASSEARSAILAHSPFFASVIQYPARLGQKTIEAITDYFDSPRAMKPLLIPVGLCSQRQGQDCAAPPAP